MKETIQYDDFAKLDIRVGTITECENVEKSNKLLKLQVDLGELGMRQVLTGMATWYSPKDFTGKQALFIINLEPRKMMGLESQGMMLSIGGDNDEKPILIEPKEQAINGDFIS